uniref:Alkyl transferase n=2 Tax=Macrostomum lignano TaxID=282301 RepID=A0A1I8GKR7_9PLAT
LQQSQPLPTAGPSPGPAEPPQDTSQDSAAIPEDEWIRTGAQYTAMQRLSMTMLGQGPLLNHLAIIMDGNRRFARCHGLQKSQGHLRGFQKVGEVLEWCRDLGINEVTVYAFSIENFNRSAEEVAGLLRLARQKFDRLLQELDRLRAYGVCVRVLGNLQLLPADLRAAAARVMQATSSHSKARLNVCFAYTSRDDMAHAVSLAGQAVRSGLLLPDDVTPRLLDRCARTYLSPGPPDLLIRTSGETRLSDFLLWQTQFTCVHFVNAMWPDFSVWHLMWAVFNYQRNYATMQSGLAALAAEEADDDDETQSDPQRHQRLQAFDKFVHDQEDAELRRYLAAET